MPASRDRPRLTRAEAQVWAIVAARLRERSCANLCTTRPPRPCSTTWPPIASIRYAVADRLLESLRSTALERSRCGRRGATCKSHHGTVLQPGGCGARVLHRGGPRSCRSLPGSWRRPWAGRPLRCGDRVRVGTRSHRRRSVRSLAGRRIGSAADRCSWVGRRSRSSGCSFTWTNGYGRAHRGPVAARGRRGVLPRGGAGRGECQPRAGGPSREALSFLSLSLYLGIAIGPFIGETLLGVDDFNLVWLVAAALTAVAAVLSIGVTCADGRCHHPSATYPPDRSRRDLPRVDRPRGTVGNGRLHRVPSRVCAFGCMAASLPLLVYGMTVVGLRIVGARVPDRFGSGRVASVALALSAVGLAIMGLSPTPHGCRHGGIREGIRPGTIASMPGSIERVFVAGAGLMGHGIAQVHAAIGLPVTLYEPDLARAEAGRDRIAGNLDRAVAKGRLTAESATRRSPGSRSPPTRPRWPAPTSSSRPCSRTSRSRRRSGASSTSWPRRTRSSPHTSSIAIHRLAEAVALPSRRFVGMHFFSPAPVMPLHRAHPRPRHGRRDGRRHPGTCGGARQAGHRLDRSPGLHRQPHPHAVPGRGDAGIRGRHRQRRGYRRWARVGLTIRWVRSSLPIHRARRLPRHHARPRRRDRRRPLPPAAQPDRVRGRRRSGQKSGQGFYTYPRPERAAAGR